MVVQYVTGIACDVNECMAMVSYNSTYDRQKMTQNLTAMKHLLLDRLTYTLLPNQTLHYQHISTCTRERYSQTK